MNTLSHTASRVSFALGVLGAGFSIWASGFMMFLAGTVPSMYFRSSPSEISLYESRVSHALVIALIGIGLSITSGVMRHLIRSQVSEILIMSTVLGIVPAVMVYLVHSGAVDLSTDASLLTNTTYFVMGMVLIGVMMSVGMVGITCDEPCSTDDNDDTAMLAMYAANTAVVTSVIAMTASIGR